jgi:hypothetical protein
MRLDARNETDVPERVVLIQYFCCGIAVSFVQQFNEVYAV